MAPGCIKPVRPSPPAAPPARWSTVAVSAVTSIELDFPHQRHVTDSTSSARTSSSSTECSPPNVKCQKARVRRDDTTSKRVRFPQAAQR